MYIVPMVRWLALALVLCAACPEGQPAATSECERIGDQCRLGEGLLGVCSPAQSRDCAEPPCLVCTPQH
jgi:hypothetical protein